MSSVAAVAFAAGISVQCQGAAEDCTPGTLDCACVVDQCLEGLQCFTGRCVDLDGPNTTEATPTSGMSDPTADPTASSDPGTTTGPSTTSDTNPSDTNPSDTNPSDPTNASATATTGEPGVCGDGELDPGETCDDGNQVDDDACTNACEPGSAPVLVFLDGKPSMVLGTAAGMSFSDMCKGPLRGLGGSEQVGTYLAQLRGECANAALVPVGGGYELELSPGPSLPAHGTVTPMAIDSVCPAGQVVTGFLGYADGLGLSGLSLQCSPLSVDPNTLAVKIGAATSLPLIGGMGDGPIGNSSCPVDYVAVGLLGFVETTFNTIGATGLHCARPTVQ